MHKVRSLVVLALSGTLAAACGGGSSSGGGGGSAGGDTSPVKVALIVPLSGAQAIPKIYVDPAEMAVNELNAGGGISGRKVQLVQIDSGFTPATAITAVNKAIGEKVSAIVGLPVEEQDLAVKSLIDNAKIPMFQLSVGDEANYLQGASGGSSQYSFRIGDANSAEVSAATQFAVTQLKAKKVGLMYQSDDSAQSVKQFFEQNIKSTGGTIGTERSFPITTTDLTDQVLAMKGSDAVLNWSYPNFIALGLKQQVQNGIDVPVVGSQSAYFVWEDKLVPAADLKYLYEAATCNPVDDSRSNVKSWLASFQKTYKWTPDQSSAETYDAVKIFASVFKSSGGSSSGMLSALEKLNYTSGICAPAYKTDAAHNTAHSSVVISFTGTKPTTVKSYTTPAS